MEAWLVKRGGIYSKAFRILVLAVTLLIVAVMIIFAFDYEDGYESYGLQYCAPGNIIHIEVCDASNIRVYPYNQIYYIEENYYGNTLVRLLSQVEIDEVIVTMPYGWHYRALYVKDDYYSEKYHHVIVMELVLPVSAYYEYRSTYEDPGIYYEPYDYNQYDYDLYGGYIGYVPDYIGLVPFGAGRVVTFNPNGGSMALGHELPLLTMADGRLDSVQFANHIAPSKSGRAFMWWSLSPEGLDPAVTHIDDVFSCDTYVPYDITLYAVWGIEVRFGGNGAYLPGTGLIPSVPPDPTNPDVYSERLIPFEWSFDDAELFGLPVIFPNDPTRPAFIFWGWYDTIIEVNNIDSPPASPIRAINRYTPIDGNIYAHARWRLHTHLVMFDMNHPSAVLTAGTATQPQRLYRWALDGRSIADSGLGGAALTGVGPHGVASPVSLDGSPWSDLGAVPHEVSRQNRLRPWVPNYPPGDANHLPREHPRFTTPFYPGQSPPLVRGTAGGVISPDAGTMNPRSAPTVSIPSVLWIPEAPFESGMGTNVLREIYTLEGWWTTPYGWRNNTSQANIEGRRFAPAAHIGVNTHISPSFSTSHDATIHAFPEGFPRGLARTVNDYPYPRDHANHRDYPPTGIVTEDMQVYANWVYRVTFNLNQGTSHGLQGFSVAGNDNFNPRGSNDTNFRDILPCLPEAERTINQSGQRVRFDNGIFSGNSYVAHQPVAAGFPPYESPHKSGHIFNGWWDRPVPPVGEFHYQTCTDGCTTPFCYPARAHNAQRIEGDTLINGSMTAYAHWRERSGQNVVYIIFNLNSETASISPDGTSTTEGEHGYAYWPTHARYLPGDSYTNPLNRFFLSRWGGGPHPGGGMQPANNPYIHIPGPTRIERNHRYSLQNLAYANVHYDDRYSRELTRQYAYGASIRAGHQPHSMGGAVTNNNVSYQRFPRNPRRAGYVFVGWSLQPDTPPIRGSAAVPIGATSIANPIAHHHIWHADRNLTAIDGMYPGATVTFYAVWAPAFDLIFDGNGNTGHTGAPIPSPGTVRITNPLPPGTVRTYFTRPMPLGFTLGDLHDGILSRWGSNACGNTWASGGWYSYPGNQVGRFFNRANYRLVFYWLPPPSIPPTQTFNTDREGRPGHGSLIANNTRFTEAFFHANGGVVDDVSGRPLYMRVFAQWGGTLTFRGNHPGNEGLGRGPSRTALIAEGQSVNMTVNTATRNLNMPNVEEIWLGNWQGTTGPTGNRGGWPRDPQMEEPPRFSDVYGGDWDALFRPPSTGALLGWRRTPTITGPLAYCANCTAGNQAECIFGGVYWVTADTPIRGNTTIYAIWSNHVIFHPGLGGDDVDMTPLLSAPGAEMTSEGYVIRTVPNGIFNPLPADPVWGARTFLGWFNVPWFDRTADNQPQRLDFPTTAISSPRRFYAVFGVVVRFRAYGPGPNLGAGGYMSHHPNPALCPGYLDREHTAGGALNIMHYRQEGGNWFLYQRPSRPGWETDQFAGEWFRVIPNPLDPNDFTNREIFRPHCHRFGISPYNTVMDNMTVYAAWNSRITFRPGHVRGLLENDGYMVNEEVLRTVPEGLTLVGNNPASQRVPAVSVARCEDWVNDPGLRFLGWRKVNRAGQPISYENGVVTVIGPSDPLPDLWACDEVKNMTATLPHHFFEAVWQLRLEFYKVTTALPSNPINHLNGYYPLANARFVLERYGRYELEYVNGDLIRIWIPGWAQVYPPPSATPAFVLSDGNGRVSIGMGTTYAPGLWLPQEAGWPCGLPNCSSPNCGNTGCGILEFRLREILAPIGYITPAGYWTVTISRYLGMLPIFDNAGIPSGLRDYLDFQLATIDEGPWEGLMQFVRNLPYDFHFWKTTSTETRLSGAQFSLFVYNGVGTPSDVMITQAMIAADEWSLVGQGISSATAAMRFTMRPDRYYQLIETVPPAGHQVPMGQWRITVDSAMPATIRPTLTIDIISYSFMPNIIPITPHSPQTYVIHNWADFYLPRSGGSGTRLYVFIGMLLIMTAAGIMLFNKYRRIKKVII